MEKQSKYILLKKFYNNKKVLVTGANGFKGLWLSFILKTFGCEIFGIGIKNKNYLFSNYINLERNIKFSEIDIRNYKCLKKYINKIKPDIIFHLASESLVTDCNNNPKIAYDTNVMGLVNLLETYRVLDQKKITQINIVTSDKCYLPQNKKNYSENDILGGNDIYSATKSCQEMIAKSYYESYFKKEKKILISTFRAGNVIGGGDYSKDRLFVDISKVLDNNKQIKIRNKNSTRPWQHVLDCLNGYLNTAMYCHNNKINFSNWNFAPSYKSMSVKYIVDYLVKKKYLKKKQVIYVKNFLKESLYLNLNSKETQKKIKWKNVFNFEKTIEETILFYIEINKLKNKNNLLTSFLESKIYNFYK